MSDSRFNLGKERRYGLCGLPKDLLLGNGHLVNLFGFIHCGLGGGQKSIHFLFDIFGSRSRVHGELPNLFSDYRKAAAHFSGPGSLYRSVQRKEVCLGGNLAYRGDLFGYAVNNSAGIPYLLGNAVDTADHGISGLLEVLDLSAGSIRGLMHILGNVVELIGRIHNAVDGDADLVHVLCGGLYIVGLLGGAVCDVLNGLGDTRHGVGEPCRHICELLGIAAYRICGLLGLRDKLLELSHQLVDTVGNLAQLVFGPVIDPGGQVSVPLTDAVGYVEKPLGHKLDGPGDPVAHNGNHDGRNDTEDYGKNHKGQESRVYRAVIDTCRSDYGGGPVVYRYRSGDYIALFTVIVGKFLAAADGGHVAAAQNIPKGLRGGSRKGKIGIGMDDDSIRGRGYYGIAVSNRRNTAGQGV